MCTFERGKVLKSAEEFHQAIERGCDTFFVQDTLTSPGDNPTGILYKAIESMCNQGQIREAVKINEPESKHRQMPPAEHIVVQRILSGCVDMSD